MRTALVVVFFMFFGWRVALAEDFPAGLKAYQEGDYQTSAKIFFALAQRYPTNPAIIYNLGLASYQTGRKGLALGLWRKARFFANDHRLQTAISFVEEELGMATSHDGFLSAIVHWLFAFSAVHYLILSSILLVVIGWPAVTFFAKRKVPLGQWPPWIFILTPLLVLFLILGGWQTVASQKNYGTVIDAEVSTRTGPSLDSPTLVALDEGARVRIVRKHENWYQVKSQSGAAGWVLQEKVIPEKGPLQ